MKTISIFFASKLYPLYPLYPLISVYNVWLNNELNLHYSVRLWRKCGKRVSIHVLSSEICAGWSLVFFHTMDKDKHLSCSISFWSVENRSLMLYKYIGQTYKVDVNAFSDNSKTKSWKCIYSFDHIIPKTHKNIIVTTTQYCVLLLCHENTFSHTRQKVHLYLISYIGVIFETVIIKMG